MAVFYIGEIGLDKLLNQPESKFTISRDGSVRATEVFLCRTDVMRKHVGLLYGSAHPEMPYLGTDSVDGEEQEGGISRIVVNYAGYGGTNAGAGSITETFSLRRSVSAEPIDTFPGLLGMNQAQQKEYKKFKSDYESKGIVPPFVGSPPGAEEYSTLGLGALRFKYYIMGVESYYVPRMEFTRRQTMNINTSFRRNVAVGVIDIPPSKAPKFAGRDWLYKGADETQEGALRTIDDIWELSGPRGWDKYLYTKRFF